MNSSIRKHLIVGLSPVLLQKKMCLATCLPFKSRKPSMNFLIAGVSLITVIAPLHAQNMIIAAGAGYKKPVTEVIDAFKTGTGTAVDALFGNLQMISSQAQQSGDISVIIGDITFLKSFSPAITFSTFDTLGKGILVLAYRKGITLQSIEGILSDSIKSIFLPQNGKTIYGIASKQALVSYGFDTMIASKCTEVATAPQVISYLLTGEADVGFINLTEALANKSVIGGYVTIQEDKYARIDIVAGVVQGFSDKEPIKKLRQFMHSQVSKDIYTKYGM